MVTARRSSETANTYENTSSAGGVGVLEKPRAYSAPVTTNAPEKQESSDAARERMQKNLDRLLNYDRYSAQKLDEPVQEEVAVAEVKDFSDEDIRPTSTTMQFGDDIDQIREEMRQASVIEDDTSYRLNNKGKLAVILYSLAVTIILALIVINTGVLASLNSSATAMTSELNSAMARYQEVQTEIESISNSNYIIDIAENQYGMVRQ